MPTQPTQPNQAPQPQVQAQQPAPAQPAPEPIQMTTPQAVHEQTAQAVASNIGQILGSDVPVEDVMPIHDESRAPSPEREQFNEMTNRIFLNKPGYEPSKSFLKKMWERLKKKNPDAIITLKEE